MKLLQGKLFNSLRNSESPLGPGDATCGQFIVPIGDATLLVQASTGGLWDHVSVSLPDRTPTWEEMRAIKEMFFEDKEWAVQFNPPPSKNVSLHPYCLHLWRPQGVVFPRPPEWMVG